MKRTSFYGYFLFVVFLLSCTLGSKTPVANASNANLTPNNIMGIEPLAGEFTPEKREMVEKAFDAIDNLEDYPNLRVTAKIAPLGPEELRSLGIEMTPAYAAKAHVYNTEAIEFSSHTHKLVVIEDIDGFIPEGQPGNLVRVLDKGSKASFDRPGVYGIVGFRDGKVIGVTVIVLPESDTSLSQPDPPPAGMASKNHHPNWGGGSYQI